MPKVQKSMRLSKLAVSQLDWLTLEFGMSESGVIQMALDNLFRSEQSKALSILLRMTDEQIDEELRVLALPDDDEDVECADTQFFDGV